jgi:hypothetical protein
MTAGHSAAGLAIFPLCWVDGFKIFRWDGAAANGGPWEKARRVSAAHLGAPQMR